ncbi:hypothetical protein Golob_020057, partial [Gossypium lobatum]|nr:hypothetical protein [Gossypium lobatum]
MLATRNRRKANKNDLVMMQFKKQREMLDLKESKYKRIEHNGYNTLFGVVEIQGFEWRCCVIPLFRGSGTVPRKDLNNSVNKFHINSSGSRPQIALDWRRRRRRIKYEEENDEAGTKWWRQAWFSKILEKVEEALVCERSRLECWKRAIQRYTITPKLRAYYITDLFRCLVRYFPIPRRIGYSPITFIARNRHYAPSAPITHSASFPFFSSVFCPRPQCSDSPTLPCT